MALTNVYISGGVKREAEFLADSDFTIGTSSASTHYVELRIMTNDGSAVTNITLRDVRFMLEAFGRLLDNQGLAGIDTNLPAS
jgi:hypothetical protein